MTPADFRWTASDNMQPNAQGAAIFKVGDKVLIQPFKSYGDAARVHEMLCAAQLDGVKHGQQSLAQFVMGAVQGFAK